MAKVAQARATVWETQSPRHVAKAWDEPQHPDLGDKFAGAEGRDLGTSRSRRDVARGITAAVGRRRTVAAVETTFNNNRSGGAADREDLVLVPNPGLHIILTLKRADI